LTVTGLFTHFFSLDTTIAERQFMRRLATLIGTRAARLSACGIAAIVSKQGLLDEISDPKTQTIGIATDGSLYNVRPVKEQGLVRQSRLTDPLDFSPAEIPQVPAAPGGGFGGHLWREGPVCC
jgi:hexokinase